MVHPLSLPHPFQKPLFPSQETIVGRGWEILRRLLSCPMHQFLLAVSGVLKFFPPFLEFPPDLQYEVRKQGKHFGGPGMCAQE